MVSSRASPTDADKQLCASIGAFLPTIGGNGNTSAIPNVSPTRLIVDAPCWAHAEGVHGNALIVISLRQEYSNAGSFVRSLPCLRIDLLALPALVSLGASFVASLVFSLCVAHAASSALLGRSRAESPLCGCCEGSGREEEEGE